MNASVFRALILCLALLSAMFAQDTSGVITGTISDPSGATVAAAEVRIQNTDTGFTRTVTTGEAGEYRIPFVPPGNYDVFVQRAGFKSQVQHGIRIEIQQTRAVSFSLESGNTTEAVVVQSSAPLLESETSQAGT